MLIDLSHPIEHGMLTYPGLPGPVIADHLSRAASRERYRGEAEFHIGRIEMVANTGTYIDAPFHRFEDAPDIGQLPLASVANLRGVLLHLQAEKRALDIDDVAALDLRGAALLVHTGWSRHWRSEDYARAEHPYVHARRQSIWPNRAWRWSASTRSTSTTWPTPGGPRTRCCCDEAFRSSST